MRMIAKTDTYLIYLIEGGNLIKILCKTICCTWGIVIKTELRIFKDISLVSYIVPYIYA